MNDRQPIELSPRTNIARCRVCRLVQHTPALTGRERACCRRCGALLKRYAPSRVLLTRCLGLSALLLYVPANVLPIVQVEYQGRQIEITIIQGIKNLFEGGHVSVGVLVLITSFLTPVAKILGMLFLSFVPSGEWLLRGRRRLYDLILVLNPWNSMEILLLATLLTLVDFGALATINAGAGAFTAVVLLTTASSIAFQPAALWLGRGRTARL